MPDRDKQEILRLIRAQEKANVHGDAAGVLAPLATNVVSYDLPPPLEYRGDAARDVKSLQQWFDTWDGPVSVELADPTVLIDGDLAVVFGLSHMQGIKKGSGRVDNWNRRTIVLRRLDGTWRILHEHSSYPMTMDGSARAATDLKP